MKNVALITGASTGIGREFAKIHAAKGSDMIIIARNENKLNELKSELEKNHGVKVMVLAKDLSEPTAPQEVFDIVQKEGIEIDYLINNAGFGGRGKFHERDWEKDLAMIKVNIIALTALTRLFLPEFVKRNRGKILNTSSTASFMPGPLQAVYYATKAYVTFFSNAIAEELHDTNVTVTNLMPGATETEFAKTSDMDKTSLFVNPFPASEVAKDGYEAMLEGKLDIISGMSGAQKMMMRVLPFLPKTTKLKQVRKMQEV